MRTHILCMIGVLILAVPGMAETSFFDDFSSTTLDPMWQVVEYSGPFPRSEGQMAPANHYEMTGGSLRYHVDPMTYREGFVNAYQTLTAYYDYDPGLELHRSFEGDQWIFESRASYHIPASNHRGLGTRVYFGDGQSDVSTYCVDFWRWRDGSANAFVVHLIQYEPSIQNKTCIEDHIVNLTTTDDVFYSRLERCGGVLTALWSVDGSQWNTAFSVDMGDQLTGLDQRVVLAGSCWFHPVDSYADYDYVTVTSNSCPPQQCCPGIEGSLGDGLVAYYPLDGNANDASGTGHDGELGAKGGAPLPQVCSGTCAEAYSFMDGGRDTGNWINVPSLQPTYFARYTVSASFKLNSLNRPSILIYKGRSGGDVATNFKIAVSLDGFVVGEHEISGSDSVCVYSSTSIELGHWYHVALTYDGAALRLYLDASETTISNPGDPADITRWAVDIGSNGEHDGFFDGSIDEVRIYERALSPCEIESLACAQANNAPTVDAGENVQILSEEQALTLICGTANDLDGDPLEYRWLEGSELLLDWTPVGPGGESCLELGTLPYLSVGDHTLTLEVSDSQAVASDDMVLTIDNSPPDAQPAPTHQVVEIGLDPIIVAADVSDFDGDALDYEWTMGGEVLAAGTAMPPAGGEPVAIADLNIAGGDPRFGVGIHAIELVVDDGVNPPVASAVTVEVTDTTAPSISPVPSVTMLWPPNHELVPVVIQANAFDNGGGAIDLDVAVASSEPADATGDGSTIPDYYVDSVDDATGIIALRLRSERAGTGNGRTYTITVTASDAAGNQSVATVAIFAPHDRRKK